jgi:hypothetical protein
MPVLQIKGFSGVVPVSGDRALPDGYAVESVNTWLYGKELRGLHVPIDHTVCSASTRSVLRIPKRTTGGDPAYPTIIPPPSYLYDSIMVQFADPDTDIVKGMLVEDRFERWYFCSPSTGLRFNTYANMMDNIWPIAGGYKVGVPAVNTGAPVISPAGGSGLTETRSYSYTWVNIYGEESAPSPPAVYSGGFTNATWNISGIDDPAGATFTNFAPFSKKRLYRSIMGASGATTFYRVAEIAAAVTTYADTMTDAVLAGNLKLESTSWLPPPSTLQGIIGMPNGFLIGFDKPIEEVAGGGKWSGGNNIYMSDSYHFHAWPPEFKQATETPIVGLGVLGQTCVVCTQGHPATVTGSKPATCAFTKSTTGEPCLSRGSIVSTPSGVVYASQNGLILVGPGGITNVTKDVITRDDWGKEYAPEYIRAARYQEGYLALKMTPVGHPVPRSAFYLDPSELRVALTDVSDMASILNLCEDYWSGEVFMIESGTIMRWDPSSSNYMPVRWKSKEFQFPYQENFGAYSIYWDDARFSTNGWGIGFIPADQKVRFKVYADRQVVYDQLVAKNGRPIRLPSGFKATLWQFEIASRCPVYTLHVASTMKELRQV